MVSSAPDHVGECGADPAHEPLASHILGRDQRVFLRFIARGFDAQCAHHIARRDRGDERTIIIDADHQVAPGPTMQAGGHICINLQCHTVRFAHEDRGVVVHVVTGVEEVINAVIAEGGAHHAFGFIGPVRIGVHAIENDDPALTIPFGGADQAIADDYWKSPGHNQEWFDMMNGGRAAYSNFDNAAYLTEIILLGCIALRVG